MLMKKAKRGGVRKRKEEVAEIRSHEIFSTSHVFATARRVGGDGWPWRGVLVNRGHFFAPKWRAKSVNAKRGDLREFNQRGVGWRVDTKKGCLRGVDNLFVRRVTDGIRTHDIQNHNLTL